MFTRESGNALFLILIAVGLFAALSYAITQSGRSGAGIDKETIAIELAKVAQYGASIQSAVQRLKLINGCSDTEISFENNVTSYYTNPGAPDSCKVFGPEGGSVTHPSGPSNAIWVATSAGFHRENYGYLAGISIPDIGTAENELLMTFRLKSEDICREVNRIYNGSATTPLSTDYCGAPFIGDYAAPGSCPTTNWVNVAGWHTGCVEHNTSPGEYFYYQVLSER